VGIVFNQSKLGLSLICGGSRGAIWWKHPPNDQSATRSFAPFTQRRQWNIEWHFLLYFGAFLFGCPSFAAGLDQPLICINQFLRLRF